MTDTYKLFVKKNAEKELKAVPRKDLSRIIEKLEGLSRQPRPLGCEKLEGQDRYRIRQGDWRAVYMIDDEKKTVVVFKVGHRREVYR